MRLSPNDSIVYRAARGDREAMAEIVKEHYSAVFRFCARRLGPDLAADAAQDTFVSAQKALKRFDGRSTLITWLFGVANNHCRATSRKRRMEVDFEFAWEQVEPNAPSAENLVDREMLRCAISKLTSEHREVIVLHELDGLTYDEAAEIVGVPVGTIKSRLHHAFVHLRRLVGEAQ